MLRKRPSDENVERAPYALPPGTPALQNDPSVTRRWMLLAAVGGLGLGVVGAYLAFGGSKTPSTSPPPPEAGAHGDLPDPRSGNGDARLAWARDLARGPLDELIAKHRTFLMVVDLNKHDELLWDGVERLADHALSASDAQTLEMVELYLLPTMRSPRLPTYLRQIRDRLESRVKNLRKGR